MRQEIKRRRLLLFAVWGAAALLAAGCASVKAPEVAQNPPPSEAFSRFAKFELKPIKQGPQCDKKHGADEALMQIQGKLSRRLRGLFEGWAAAPEEKASNRTLIVEPVCVSARMIGTAGRLAGGIFAGDSGVVLNVRYIDASSGKLIAEPVFYQRANVFGGMYSFGATDRDMLERMVSLITRYTSDNYMAAVGGPTGLETQSPVQN
jgi:hypothetical protein